MIERQELVVFDFDDTVVNCNSDTWVDQLAPDGKIPKDIRAIFDGVNWTNYMAAVFKYLFANGVTREDYERCLHAMPFVQHVKELLEELASKPSAHGRKYELIVISDANTFFIQTFLEHHSLFKAFA